MLVKTTCSIASIHVYHQMSSEEDSDGSSGSESDEEDYEPEVVLPTVELNRVTFAEPDSTPIQLEIQPEYEENPFAEPAQPAETNNVLYKAGVSKIDPKEKMFHQIAVALNEIKATFDCAIYLPGRHIRKGKFVLPFVLMYDTQHKVPLDAGVFFPSKAPRLIVIHKIQGAVTPDRIKGFTAWKHTQLLPHYTAHVYRHLDAYEEEQLYFVVLQLSVSPEIVKNVHSQWLSQAGATFGSVANSDVYNKHLATLKSEAYVLLYYALVSLTGKVPASATDEFCAIVDNDKIPKIHPSTAVYSNVISAHSYSHEVTTLDYWYTDRGSYVYLPLLLEDRFYLMQVHSSDVGSLLSEPALPYHLTEADGDLVRSSRTGKCKIPSAQGLSALLGTTIEILPLTLMS